MLKKPFHLFSRNLKQHFKTSIVNINNLSTKTNNSLLFSNNYSKRTFSTLNSHVFNQLNKEEIPQPTIIEPETKKINSSQQKEPITLSTIFSVLKESIPPKQELLRFLSFITLIFLFSLFILSDYFLNILLSIIMKVFGWDELFSYESVSGCFFCGSTTLKNFKFKKGLKINDNQLLEGDCEYIFAIIPWIYLIKERILKYFNKERESNLYIPKIALVGGSLRLVDISSSPITTETEESKGKNKKAFPLALGFDSTNLGQLEIYDTELKGTKVDDNLLLSFEEFKVIEEIKINEKERDLYFPISLMSKGSFKWNNQIKFTSHIYSNKVLKSEESLEEGFPYEEMTTQWEIKNINADNDNNELIVLLRYLPKYLPEPSIQLQVHQKTMNNNNSEDFKTTPIYSTTIPRTSFNPIQLLNSIPNIYSLIHANK
ncbi:hypothetical protein ABK040_006575 [Willaertia magna]